MESLERQVILITNVSTWPGYNAAFTLSDANAAVVVNDETGAGTMRAAAEATAKDIKRRRCGPAIPAYGNTRDRRKCIEMVRVGPDRWDWLSGVVVVGGLSDLEMILEVAVPELEKWGGNIVMLDADEACAALVRAQAPALLARRITLNAILPSEEPPASMLNFFFSSLGVGKTGMLVQPALTLSPTEIAAGLDALIVPASAPAARPEAVIPEPPALQEPDEPAEAPPAPRAKAAAPASKPAAKETSKKSAKKSPKKG